MKAKRIASGQNRYGIRGESTIRKTSLINVASKRAAHLDFLLPAIYFVDDSWLQYLRKQKSTAQYAIPYSCRMIFPASN
jgi:hypothetical protein